MWRAGVIASGLRPTQRPMRHGSTIVRSMPHESTMVARGCLRDPCRSRGARKNNAMEDPLQLFNQARQGMSEKGDWDNQGAVATRE